jgi:hypothetical protein
MDNLQVLWTLVDAFRRSADDLEADVRRLGGDRPELEFVETDQLVGFGSWSRQEIDKIQAYKNVIEALEGARNILAHVADHDGRPPEPRKLANRCHVLSRRCDDALEGLLKVGEL